MFRDLKEAVLKANLRLNETGLVISTFGNVSACDRRRKAIAIKPSGVPYAKLSVEDIVVTDFTGAPVEGRLRPSSDLETHLVLYDMFPTLGAVAHTHSHYATAWSQAGRPIPPLGTTHADYFFGEIPVTERLTSDEIDGDYVGNTGRAIGHRLNGRDPYEVPAILVAGHGPFCWGHTADEAVENAIMLETVARLAYHTKMLSSEAALPCISSELLQRHFFRKHGAGAFYGQAHESGEGS